MTAQEIIGVIYPLMAASDDVDSYINLARMSTNAKFFGEKYTLAVALRACHMYYLNNRMKGDAGRITSAREGTLSISYGGTGDTGYLSASSYGMQLQDLINGSGMRGMTTSTYIQQYLL